MGNLLLIAGVILIIGGLIINIFHLTGLPMLPGDILIKGKDSFFYFPIVSSIVISIILTVVFNLLK